MYRRQKFLKYSNKFLSNFNFSLSNSAEIKQLNELINKMKVYDLGHNLIRVGPEGDGGYLLPDIIKEIDYCFSPGVGKSVEFEKKLIKLGLKKIFLADGTIDGSSFISEKIDFIKKNLSSYNSENNITLKNWINQKLKKEDQKNLILQMDIESSEYEVINSIDIEYLLKFKILVIEFHFLENLFFDFGLKIIRSAFEKILQNFEIAHIHPNNCCGIYTQKNISIPSVMEFTFLKKDLALKKNNCNKFPHKLDFKNKLKFKDITLPKNFYL